MVLNNTKFGSATSSRVQELKEKGNKSLKQGNHAEAVFHYTHALKIDPNQYQLYSNRSLAFLKMQQYYYALEDAKEVIRLKPDWAKGFYRKAEVEFHSENYADAVESYRHALQLHNEDFGLVDSIRKAKREMLRLQKEDIQHPWLGAGLGFIIGVLIVVGDFILLEVPLIKHPFFKLLVIVVVAGISFTLARLYRIYLYQSRKSLLDPPVDLLGENESDSLLTKTNRRNSKSTPAGSNGSRRTKADKRK